MNANLTIYPLRDRRALGDARPSAMTTSTQQINPEHFRLITIDASEKEGFVTAPYTYVTDEEAQRLREEYEPIRLRLLAEAKERIATQRRFTLAEWEALVMEYHWKAGETLPRPEVIECPECDGELVDTNPSVVYYTDPLAAAVHCPKCGWKDYRSM